MKRIIFAALAVALLPAVTLAQASRTKSGLTHDQIHSLQQALADDGCYSGRVDGVMGPKTRSAIACARRKHDLEGNNANELFRALNLDFTIEDSTGMGGIMRGGNRQPERRRDRSIVDVTDRDHADVSRDSVEAREREDRRARGDTIGMENKGKGRGKPKKPVTPKD
jgi:hypothetical protein